MATVGRLVFLTFVVCMWEERERELRFAWLASFRSFPATDVLALVRCHVVDIEPLRSLNHIKAKNEHNINECREVVATAKSSA